jgi:hypothetical protein
MSSQRHKAAKTRGPKRQKTTTSKDRRKQTTNNTTTRQHCRLQQSSEVSAVLKKTVYALEPYMQSSKCNGRKKPLNYVGVENDERNLGGQKLQPSTCLLCCLIMHPCYKRSCRTNLFTTRESRRPRPVWACNTTEQMTPVFCFSQAQLNMCSIVFEQGLGFATNLLLCMLLEKRVNEQPTTQSSQNKRPKTAKNNNKQGQTKTNNQQHNNTSTLLTY